MAEWRLVPNSNVEVCSDGRVRRDGVEFVPCIGSHGYRHIGLNGKKVLLHRLIATAFIPNPESKKCVDHADGDKLNNSVDNLRWATVAENNRNSGAHPKKSSLPRGVYQRGKRFEAQIRCERKQHYLGSYETPEEASEMYEAKAQELFGEFYRSL